MPCGDGTVLVRQEEKVRWLTLNRPQARNALDDELSERLVEALKDAAADEEVRCVVLTGAPPAFCAGGDLGMMSSVRESLAAEPYLGAALNAGIRRSVRRVSASLLLHTMPKPTVAMVNGHAVGGGLSLALACDLRVVSEDARLIVRFLSIGLSGDYGLTYFLPRLVGLARARRLLLLDDEITPREAERIGMVDAVVPGDQLLATTTQWAERLAAGPPVASGLVKQNLRLSDTSDLETMLEREVINTRIASLTADAREGAASLRERREPRFTGR